MPLTPYNANGLILFLSKFYDTISESIPYYIPGRINTLLTKSFPIRNTGNLSYLSLIYGFVRPYE